MGNENLLRNQQYVNEHVNEFLNLYLNKYILIKDQEVVGSFDTYDAAAEEGIKAYGTKGDFLVYYVTESNPVNFISTAII